MNESLKAAEVSKLTREFIAAGASLARSELSAETFILLTLGVSLP